MRDVFAVGWLLGGASEDIVCGGVHSEDAYISVNPAEERLVNADGANVVGHVLVADTLVVQQEVRAIHLLCADRKVLAARLKVL